MNINITQLNGFFFIRIFFCSLHHVLENEKKKWYEQSTTHKYTNKNSYIHLSIQSTCFSFFSISTHISHYSARGSNLDAFFVVICVNTAQCTYCIQQYSICICIGVKIYAIEFSLIQNSTSSWIALMCVTVPRDKHVFGLKHYIQHTLTRSCIHA